MIKQGSDDRTSVLAVLSLAVSAVFILMIIAELIGVSGKEDPDSRCKGWVRVSSDKVQDGFFCLDGGFENLAVFLRKAVPDCVNIYPEKTIIRTGDHLYVTVSGKLCSVGVGRVSRKKRLSGLAIISM